MNSRVAVLVAAGMAALALLWFTFRPPQEQSAVASAVQAVDAAAKPVRDVSPTLGNYRVLADRSLEALDQELTRERASSAFGAPVYKASSMALAITPD